MNHSSQLEKPDIANRVVKPDKNSRVCLTLILPRATIISKLTDIQGKGNYDSGNYKPQPS